MATIDEDRISTWQIEKLTEKNYRSWATTVRATLHEKRVFDVVEGLTTAPVKLADTASADERTAYNTELEALSTMPSGYSVEVLGFKLVESPSRYLWYLEIPRDFQAEYL
jgi:hypothetical protein